MPEHIKDGSINMDYDMDPMLLQIENELTNLLPEGKSSQEFSFLLAVSGGMDSMVMAHCFLALNISFGLAHFNFKLRGKDSDLDEELVAGFCQNHQIPFHARSEDTIRYAKDRKLSIQESARELRYGYFDELMEEYGYDYLCTAHHGNDQVETVFINLFRGSGLKGMTGIPQIRNRILRPMLWIPQSMIRDFAQKNSIAFREDESNASDKYLRNHIRHRFVEAITDSNPEYLIKALDSIKLLTDYQLYIDYQLDAFKRKYVETLSSSTMKITMTDDSPDTFNYRFLLRLFLLDQGMFPNSVQDFMQMYGQWKNGASYKGLSMAAWYDRKKLWIIRDSFYDDWNREDEIELIPNEIMHLPGGDYLQYLKKVPKTIKKRDWLIPVDLTQVKLPLHLRHRHPGDTIELGSPPYFRKSIKKLFNERQVPRPFKDRLYILTDSRDQIISIPGMVNSPRYTNDQDTALLINYHCSLLYLFD